MRIFLVFVEISAYIFEIFLQTYLKHDKFFNFLNLKWVKYKYFKHYKLKIKIIKIYIKKSYYGCILHGLSFYNIVD